MTELWKNVRRNSSDIMYDILHVLVDGQPIGKTRLMNRIGIQWSSFNSYIDKLVEKGFVMMQTRQVSPKTYRYRVTITNDGVALYKELIMLRRFRDD